MVYWKLAVTVIMSNNSTGITMNALNMSLKLHQIERQHLLMYENPYSIHFKFTQ